jgi:membrane-bound serine protease (ClpP class)
MCRVILFKVLAVVCFTALPLPAFAEDIGEGGVDPEATVSRGSLNPAKRGMKLPGNAKVMVIPVNTETTKYGFIDEWQANFISRRLKRAQAENYDLVILEIDTPGGSIDACDQITRAIAACPVPVVAYVKGKAFSGGAIISLGSKAIVMAPGSIIGGAKAVTLWGGDVPASMQQKIDSDLRAASTNLAEANNHPVPIAVGMVNSDVEVYEIKDPAERFVTGERLEELARERGAKPDVVHQWKKKDQILTLTAREAVNTGLAAGIVVDEGEIYTGLNVQPAAIDRADLTAAESAARFVSHPIWRVLLVIVGLVALFWELKSPGHGIGYILFAFCLGAFFWLQVFSNNAGLWEILLFGLGAVLVAMELFLIPGFGVAGFIGFAMILLSIILSFVPEGVSLSTIFNGKSSGASDFDLERLNRNLFWAAMTLVSIVVVVLTGLLRGAKLPGFSRMALQTEVAANVNSARPEAAAAAGNTPTLVGQSATTETVLRPAGKVRLGGVTYDAVSEGSFLDPGTNVVVLRMQGTTLVVRQMG